MVIVKQFYPLCSLEFSMHPTLKSWIINKTILRKNGNHIEILFFKQDIKAWGQCIKTSVWIEVHTYCKYLLYKYKTLSALKFIKLFKKFKVWANKIALGKSGKYTCSCDWLSASRSFISKPLTKMGRVLSKIIFPHASKHRLSSLC